MTNHEYKHADGTVRWRELHTSSVDTKSGSQQFPGVYFSAITQQNLLTEPVYPYTSFLLFSRDLLAQGNYHVNITDNNGFISEGNTYFPANLRDAVDKINANARVLPDTDRRRMNEVVFYHPISMDFCCGHGDRTCKSVWRDPSVDYDIPVCNEFLPDYPITSLLSGNSVYSIPWRT
jgi:hypothetical protein